MDYIRYVEELGAGQPELPGGLRNVVAVERVGSTNALARRVAGEYEREDEDVPELLIVALEQTAGRGRQGRTWTSPRGKGVYATLVRRLAPASALATLPLLVGVGLCRALDRYLPSGCRLKWPNDLLAGGRKIGGVLIETRLRPPGGGEAVAAGVGEAAVAAPGEGAVTVLIGFGVNQAHERSDLPGDSATSLQLEGAPETSLAALTWDLVGGIEEELTRFGDAGYAVARYRERSEHAAGDRLRCRGAGCRKDASESEVEGTFLGFDDQGRLRLDVAGEERRLAAGEVMEW